MTEADKAAARAPKSFPDTWPLSALEAAKVKGELEATRSTGSVKMGSGIGEQVTQDGLERASAETLQIMVALTKGTMLAAAASRLVADVAGRRRIVDNTTATPVATRSLLFDIEVALTNSQTLVRQALAATKPSSGKRG